MCWSTERRTLPLEASHGAMSSSSPLMSRDRGPCVHWSALSRRVTCSAFDTSTVFHVRARSTMADSKAPPTSPTKPAPDPAAPSCGICLNPYESDFKSVRLPRILWSCGHTLCVGCITPLIKEQKAKCPYDRIETSAPNGIDSFPPNRGLIDVIGEATEVAAKKETITCSNCEEKAAKWICPPPGCRDDQLFCDDCYTSIHSPMKGAKAAKHSKVLIAECASYILTCTVHAMPLALFCCKDEVPICHTCKEKNGLHFGHETLAVQRAVTAEMQKQAEEAKRTSTDMNVLLRHVSATIGQTHTNAQRVADEIRKYSDSLKQAIDVRTAELLGEVKSVCQTKVKSLETLGATASVVLSEAQQLQSRIAKGLETNDLMIAKTKRSADHHADRLQKSWAEIQHTDMTDPTLSFQADESLLYTVMEYGSIHDEDVDVKETVSNDNFTSQLQMAEKGNVWAQLYVAMCYELGHEVWLSPSYALNWYRKAAVCNDMARTYITMWRETDDRQTPVKVVAALQRVSHHPVAQNLLGCAYEFEIGVTKDKKAAVDWFQKAADQGYALAQSKLGACFQFGTGVAKDEKAAVQWYRKAADQGYADAQFNLGVCFQNGTGVTKDEKVAVDWYRRAADQGNANAQYNLGVCFANGTGVPKDKKTAVDWYRKAADQGHDLAQLCLAVYYARLETKTYETRSAELP